MPREQIPVERHAYKTLAIYDVTADELDGLERMGMSLSGDLNVSSTAFSVGLTLFVTILTTHPADRIYYTMLAVMLAALVATMLFGVRYWGTLGQRGALVKRIRERVGPLGEEGKEVPPRELAKVPSQERSQGAGSPQP